MSSSSLSSWGAAGAADVLAPALGPACHARHESSNFTQAICMPHVGQKHCMSMQTGSCCRCSTRFLAHHSLPTYSWVWAHGT